MDAYVVIEAAQDILPTINERHIRAEPMENASELDRDIATALDQNMLGQAIQMKRLVRRDNVFDTRNCRPDPGRAARGDENMSGAKVFPCRQKAHRVGIDKH